MKKLMITILFLFSGFMLNAQFSGGNGTKSSPYHISSKADMEALADSVNSIPMYSANKYFELTNDITDTVRTIIGGWYFYGGIQDGDHLLAFRGHFDGKHHTVNVNVSGGNYVGLFGILFGGSIRNLKVKGKVTVEINGHEGVAGGIVGEATRNIDSSVFTYIDSCENFADINVPSDGGTGEGGVTPYTGNSIGGIAGIAMYTTITNCNNFGRVCGEIHVGGIAGRGASAPMEIFYCNNFGSISSKRNHHLTWEENTSGISGNGTINNNNNFGKIVSCSYVGGIVNRTGQTKYCNSNYGIIDLQPSSSSCDYYGSCFGEGSSVGINFYDKQMSIYGGIDDLDVLGVAEGRLTEDMVGNGLRSVWGDSVYIYEDSLYPRLGNLPAHYVGASPIFLAVRSSIDYDRYNDIKHCFKLSTKHGVIWSSTTGRVSIVGDRAILNGIGWDTLKCSIGIYKKQIPICITAISNDCYDSVNVLLISGDSAVGTVSGGGRYYFGDAVIISGKVNDTNSCYEFDRWSNKYGNTVSTSPNTTIIVKDKDTVLTAQFEFKKYLLSIKSSPDNVGLQTPSGGGRYLCGSYVDVEAKDKDCYKFLYWIDLSNSNTIYSYARKIEVLMDRDIQLLAVYQGAEIRLHSVPAIGGLVNGSVSYTERYSCSTNIGIISNANTGYRFRHWEDSVTKDIVSIDSVYSFTINGLTILNAIFENYNKKYKLTLKTEPEGVATTIGEGEYDSNSVVSISSNKTDSCYRFIGWYDNAEQQISHNNFTTVKMQGDTILTARYIKEPYLVTISTEPTTTGKVEGIENGFYDCGYTTTVTAIETDTNYRFVKWSNDVTDNPLALRIVSDTNIVAIFKYTSVIGNDEDNINIIYDNAQGVIVVELRASEHTTISIYNILGIKQIEQIDELTPPPLIRTIDISRLPRGIYFVKIQIGTTTKLIKIVK